MGVRVHSNSGEDAGWWGPVELPPGTTGHWAIGPLDLWLKRCADEWDLWLARERDPEESGFRREIPAREPVPEKPAEQRRFAGTPGGATATLAVALADRPVVSRPEAPFHVPAGGEVTLYVSTPAWVQLRLGETRLHEFPAYPASDTWFGPNTVEGELCYASRTQARMTLEDVPERAHRVLTPLTVHNAARDTLLLERIKLPVPRLPVYADARGRLWTSAVRVQHEPERDLAEVKLGEGPPAESPRARRVAEPRESGGSRFSLRAFSALFQ
ncbi:hypothetical protein [Thioalkalivibrio sp. ALE19]|uniref:hypothetical protein n=1 Tax=Thioalkalivibrio sp. ALE19 TaxID=1266909 RepID=UPI0004232ED0|nr:hypothetical protein [Thioalkalivibrio sp. ALE19]